MGSWEAIGVPPDVDRPGAVDAWAGDGWSAGEPVDVLAILVGITVAVLASVVWDWAVKRRYRREAAAVLASMASAVQRVGRTGAPTSTEVVEHVGALREGHRSFAPMREHVFSEFDGNVPVLLDRHLVQVESLLSAVALVPGPDGSADCSWEHQVAEVALPMLAAMDGCLDLPAHYLAVERFDLLARLALRREATTLLGSRPARSRRRSHAPPRHRGPG